MIPVTQPYLPERATLDCYLDGIYERRWLTNNGPLVQDLTARLEEYLGVSNLLLVANGTLALQVAFELLQLKGEAVTTPFTFAATSSALRWQGITPRYADIDPDDLNLDPDLIEDRINEQTGAIVPVHVYGNPCRTDAIERIATKHGLPVVYDAAHAFGVQQHNQSVLNAGDISTLSFHATKLFHTVEGGALIIRDPEQYEHAQRMINFGFGPDGETTELGINAKMSEFHAAMGLAVLDSIDDIMTARVELVAEYRRCLAAYVSFQKWTAGASENGAYLPVLLASSEQAKSVDTHLKKIGVYPRRYFSPALHEVTLFANGDNCPVASNVSQRVLCLPLYAELTLDQVRWIAGQVVSGLGV